MVRLSRFFSVFFIVLVSVVFTSVLVSCGGGGGGGGGNGDPAPTTYAALSTNIYTGDTYTDAEVSIDANGDSIVRTKLAILFTPSATKAEVDALLARINAIITSSVAGARSVSIRIPDPITVDALNIIIADIESESFVEAALKSKVRSLKILPDNVIEGNTSDYEIIDNSLAIRGAAAWNAKEAITTAPNIIIADGFERGVSQLNTFLDATISGTIHNNPPGPDDDDHGYHVAGIIAGSFGGGTSTAGLVTGIFPGHSNLHIIEIDGLSSFDLDNLIVITAASTNGTVVLNTSLGDDCSTLIHYGTCREREMSMIEGIVWADLVRSTGLETKMFHATAAGNRTTLDGTDYNLRDAQTSSNWSAAATMTNMTTTDGTHVPPLSNTVSVENLRGTDTHPRKVLCLDENSFVGGNISAIGTQVTSILSTGTAKYDGTSMATPQVAGLAAYLLSIDSSLSAQQIRGILLNTAQSVQGGGAGNCSDWSAPSPAIDAYAAVLALDKESALSGNRSNAPVRSAILDIADASAFLGTNGQFDENDLTYYAEEIDAGSQAIRDGTETVTYSRADLNGDGYDGGGFGYKKSLISTSTTRRLIPLSRRL